MIGKHVKYSCAAGGFSAIALAVLVLAGCGSSNPDAGGVGGGTPEAGGASGAAPNGGAGNVTSNGGAGNVTGNGGTGNVTSTGGTGNVTGNGGTGNGGTGSGGTGSGGTGNGGTGNVTGSGGTGNTGGAGGTIKCPANCQLLSSECFCPPAALFAPPTDFVSDQKTCQTVGLNLATVHDKAESDAIGAVLAGMGLSGQNSDVFIGLNDPTMMGNMSAQGPWQWVSGAPFSFTNWLSGQPNNSPLGGAGGEHCVAIQASGQWDDFPCGQSVGFVCN